MIDWEGAVLAPLMSIFALPIVFTPVVSQPDAPAYVARGVYALKEVSVPTAEGVFTDQQPTLGIKLGDFAVPPKQNDIFVLNGVSWWIWDCLPDGQGGADLVIKQTPAPTS